MEELNAELSSAQESLASSLSKEAALSEELAASECRLDARSKQLAEAHAKRQLAKEEVLKLHEALKKLEAKASTVEPVNLREVPESKALMLLKGHISLLHKRLIELMMGARTLKSANNQLFYRMQVDHFAGFEQELSQVLRNVHEVADCPELAHEESWLNKLSALVKPSSFFGCVGSTERPSDRPWPGHDSRFRSN